MRRNQGEPFFGNDRKYTGILVSGIVNRLARFRARPRTDSSAIPAKRKSGEGTEGTRVTGEDSAFRYDLERSDKITVSKLLISAIPAIADPTGKSGIPVAESFRNLVIPVPGIVGQARSIP